MSYEHRRATAVIRVLDASGRPVANRKLRLEQTTHDFLFGCGAFDAIPYANGKGDDPLYKDRIGKPRHRQAEGPQVTQQVDSTD